LKQRGIEFPQEAPMAQVLIIEDSPTQAQQLALLLEDAGFEVNIAPNAECSYASLTER
jgi:CheY-like chemotaxis protein